MDFIKAKKVVAPVVLDADGIKATSLIEICDDGSARVSPFDRETAGTVFHPGPVAIVRVDAVTEFLLDDIGMLHSFSVIKRISLADRLLRPASLYAESGSPAVILAL